MRAARACLAYSIASFIAAAGTPRKPRRPVARTLPAEEGMGEAAEEEGARTDVDEAEDEEEDEPVCPWGRRAGEGEAVAAAPVDVVADARAEAAVAAAADAMDDTPETRPDREEGREEEEEGAEA